MEYQLDTLIQGGVKFYIFDHFNLHAVGYFETGWL